MLKFSAEKGKKQKSIYPPKDNGNSSQRSSPHLDSQSCYNSTSSSFEDEATYTNLEKTNSLLNEEDTGTILRKPIKCSENIDESDKKEKRLVFCSTGSCCLCFYLYFSHILWYFK